MILDIYFPEGKIPEPKKRKEGFEVSNLSLQGFKKKKEKKSEHRMGQDGPVCEARLRSCALTWSSLFLRRIWRERCPGVWFWGMSPCSLDDEGL